MRGPARSVFVAAMLAATSAQANLGVLDPSFGRGGVLRVNVGWGGLPSSARVVLQQSDGKLLVGGLGYTQQPTFGLARWTAEGALDPTFGDDGRVVTELSTDTSFDSGGGIHGLVQQPDGKVVAVGRSKGSWGSDIGVLARYLDDGSLDASFGSGGIVGTEHPEGENLQPVAIVQQPGGRLVVAASIGYDLRLTGYHPDGSIDLGFGTDGVVTLDTGEQEIASALAMLPDGRLVMAARGTVGNGTGVLIARFLEDGTPDATFGNGGWTLTPLAAGATDEQSLAVLPDGRSFVAGVTSGGATYIACHRADGELDATFGGGIVVTPAGPSRTASAAQVMVEADGRVLLAVTAWAGAYDVRFRRYSATGILDPTFAPPTPTPAPSEPRAKALLRQADGRIVVAGESGSGGNEHMLVMRYGDGGVPDATFGTGGVASASVASTFEWLEATLVQHDEKIVAVGATKGLLNDDVLLLRFTRDGTLDPSFGAGGKVVTALDGRDDGAVGVVQQPDGKLVVGVYVYRTTLPRFGLVRYDTNGVIDPTFGTNGIVETSIQGNDAPVRLFQQASGKLLLVGTSIFGGSRFALVRYQANGTLDTTFGTNGVVVTPNTGRADEAIQQRDGKIVVGGLGFGPNGLTGVMVRYGADGVLDTGFGTGGKVLGSGTSGFTVLMEQTDGKIVTADANGVRRFTVAGAPDPGFPSIAPVPIYHGDVLQLPDGTILVGGDVYVEPSAHFALSHRFTDGTLDVSFGSDGAAPGVRVTPVGGFASVITSMRMLPDGRVLAGGLSDTDLVFARYLTQPCGNGQLDPGEQCDAGFDGDVCCDATCRWADTSGTCDDGDPCTVDACTVGVGCVHTAGPRPVCHAAGDSKLMLIDDANDARDRLQWKWQHGDAVTAAELGVPSAATGYGLCLYTPNGTVAASLPAGSGWKRHGTTRFSFSSPERLPHGIRKASVRSGGAGRSSALVEGRGVELPDLALPLALPLRVQLVNDAGACFEAIYDSAMRNDVRRFRAERR